MKCTRKKMQNAIWCLLLSFLWTFPVTGCSDEKKTDEVPDEWISELSSSIEFDVMGGTQEIPLTLGTGISTDHIACILSEENREWCNVKLENNKFTVSVSASGFSRTAPITLIYDKDHKYVIHVKQKSDYSKFFTDASCSKLKSGVTKAQIETIPQKQMREMALALLDGNYDTEFRVADYRPYQNPAIMAAKNKTSKYSLRDNPTGIYVDKGDDMYIYLSNVYEGAQISINIQGLSEGYGNQQSILLSEGLNRVVAPIAGLVYIFNHVDDDIPLLLETDEAKAAAAAKTVKVHFVSGKVNGYFDIQKGDTQDKWEAMLKNAQYPDIDVLGKYSHLTWCVDQFKGNNVSSNKGIITDIVRTVENCDKLVYLEQEFLGLVKYKKMFNNRMHLCLDYQASSPNASDYRTVYSKGTSYAEPFCNPDKFAERLWGPAHEVGHCNQTRPGLKWAGMTEVTNNLTAVYVQTSFGRPSILSTANGVNSSLKDENDKLVNGNYKNLYEASLDFIVNKNRAHCLPNVSSIVRETQLTPFWQLKLYMIDALGKTDFYHDLYEYFRTNKSPSEQGKNPGLDQLDFIRQVCRISGLNMLDFFEKWGFLKNVDTTLNDYGSKRFTVSKTQIEELQEEINKAGYATPAPDVYKITDDTWQNYKN